MRIADIKINSIYRIYGKKWTYYRVKYFIDDLVVYSCINLYFKDNTATEATHYNFMPFVEFAKKCVEEVVE